MKCEFIELNIEVNHLHLVVSVPSKVSIAKLLGTVKGKTAIRIFRQFTYLKNKLFLDIQFMDLQRNTHHVYRLMFHFVCIPKYRHKVFADPRREAVKAIIQKVGYDYDIDIVELEIPEVHIHMVVRSVPKQSPSRIMQIIKSISARAFLSFIQISKKIFMGR